MEITGTRMQATELVSLVEIERSLSCASLISQPFKDDRAPAVRHRRRGTPPRPADSVARGDQHLATGMSQNLFRERVFKRTQRCDDE
jgi:hypothetical protein